MAWRKPEFVCNIASFVGFGVFYSRYLPYFESRVQELRHIMRDLEYSHQLQDKEWTAKANSEFEDIRTAILSKPLLQRVDRKKIPYLRTDFSGKGMG